MQSNANRDRRSSAEALFEPGVSAAEPAWQRVIVVTVLVLAVGWLFGGFLPQSATTILSSGAIGLGDGRQNMWQLWWTARALVNGQNPFTTQLLHYPEHVSLFWQTLNVTNGLLALPITLTFGPLAAVNTLLIGTCAAATTTAYLLARRLGASRLAATTAGLIYGFSPFHLQALHDGQLEIASIQYFPLLTLTLLEVLKQPRRGWIAAAALVVLIAALTSHYFALFACLYCAAAFAAHQTGRPFDVRAAAWRAAAIGLVLAPTLLLALSRIAELDSVVNPTSADLRIRLHSLDIFDIILPSPHHPIWGTAVAQFQAFLHPNVALINVSLGVVPWLLAGIAVARRGWAVTRLHLLIGGSLILLAMGPSLRVFGHDSGIPLPYAALLQLPGLSAGQRPNHLMIPVAVHVSLLAAAGIDALRRSKPARAWAAALLVLLVVDLLPRPFVGQPLPDNDYYAAVPAGDGAVLDIPYRHEDPGAMIGQLVHGRPILGGYLARVVPHPYSYAAGIRQLIHGPASAVTVLDGDWIADLAAAAAAQRIDAIVFHRAKLTPAQQQQLAALRDVFPTVFADERVVILSPTGSAPERFTIALGAGWHVFEAPHRQWSEQRAELHVYADAGDEQAVRMTLAASSARTAKAFELQIAGQTPLRFTVEPTARRYELLLPPVNGRSDITFVTHPEQIGSDPRQLGVAVTELLVRRLRGAAGN